MRFAIPLLLVLAASATAQTDLVFRWRAPAVGDVRHLASESESETTTEMTVDGETNGGSAERSSRAVRSYEVLGVEGGRITRFAVRYHELVSSAGGEPGGRGAGRRGGGGRRPDQGAEAAETMAPPTELVGRRFTVDLGGESPRVLDERGGAVSGELARAVAALELRDGRFEGWDTTARDVLGEGTRMSVGKTIALQGETAGALLGLGRGGEVTARLTLREEVRILGRRCARFAIECSVAPGAGRGAGRGARRGGGGGGRGRGGAGTAREPRVYRGELIVGIDTLWLHRLRLSHESDSDVTRQRGDREIRIRRVVRERRDRMSIYAAGVATSPRS